jgi:hypothetical protein
VVGGVTKRDGTGPPAPPLGFDLGGYRVDFIGGDAALSAWLTEVLLPGAVAGPPGGGDAVVTVRPVPGVGSPRRPVSRLVPCFALDGELRWLPSVEVDGCLEVDDAAYGARYRLRRRHVEVDVTRNDLAPRIAVFRAVRELLVAGALGRGPAVQLHAAGVVLDGHAVLFAGPKRSGKTTLAAALAVSVGAALLANDRVMVRRDETGAMCAASLPSVVSIRAATMSWLPRLASRLPAAKDAARRARAELAGAPPASAGDERRFTLVQVARAAEVALAGAAPLRAIALLAVDHDVATAEVQRVRPSSARSRLGAVRFGAATEPRPATVFETAIGARPAGAHPLLVELARTVPVFDVRMGPGLLASEPALAQLAARLAGP